MNICREITVKGKTYHVEGSLPIGNTPSDLVYAAETTRIQVLRGSREHGAYNWATVKNGPTKHRVLCEAMKIT